MARDGRKYRPNDCSRQMTSSTQSPRSTQSCNSLFAAIDRFQAARRNREAAVMKGVRRLCGNGSCFNSHDVEGLINGFLDQADDALVADPMLQEADQPFLADRPKEVLDVGIHDPVHPPLADRDG